MRSRGILFVAVFDLGGALAGGADAELAGHAGIRSAALAARDHGADSRHFFEAFSSAPAPADFAPVGSMLARFAQSLAHQARLRPLRAQSPWTESSESV
jgi:hypothetical protein